MRRTGHTRPVVCSYRVSKKRKFSPNRSLTTSLIRSTYNPIVKNIYVSSAVVSSVAFGYYNFTHDEIIKIIGNITFTLYCGYSLLFSFANDYVKILDAWREEEAEYEEKTDPPEWDWGIINIFEHVSTAMWFMSALCGYISQLEYVAQYIQILAVVFQIYNCVIDGSNVKWTKTGLSFASIFIMMYYQHNRNIIVLFYGTFVEIGSEVLELFY